LYDAARDLGCTPTKSFWKVIFPELLPGILTGFLLALTMSLDDFIISNFTTGSGANNLSTLIYSAKLGLKPEFRALSTIIFAVIFIILIAVNIVSLKKQKKIEGGNEI
jgi:spermidine/putrescine transport system permease protein